MLGYLLFFKCLVGVFFFIIPSIASEMFERFLPIITKSILLFFLTKRFRRVQTVKFWSKMIKKNDWRGSSSRFQRFKLAKRNCISSVLTYWVFTSSSILIVTQPHIANHSNRSILLENWFVLWSILGTQ